MIQRYGARDGALAGNRTALENQYEWQRPCQELLQEIKKAFWPAKTPKLCASLILGRLCAGSEVRGQGLREEAPVGNPVPILTMGLR